MHEFATRFGEGIDITEGIVMMSKLFMSSVATVLLSATLICCNMRPAFSQDKCDVSPHDMAPIVTVEGEPSAPSDVLGEITGYDENGKFIVIRPGTTVPVTVSATAQDTSAESQQPNKIYSISLYATKVEEGTSPDRPGITNKPGQSAYSEFRGDAVSGVTNCNWVFKWSASAESQTTALYPTTFSATWKLLFLYSPGFYWYDGEAKDVWADGGYSFWSETTGAYHCLDDLP